MPLRANYSLKTLEEELEKIGIYRLETFPDGQVRWGDRIMPLDKTEKFKGRSIMTAPYTFFNPGKPRFDIFTIRNLIERLGKTEHLKEFEGRLEPRLNEEG